MSDLTRAKLVAGPFEIKRELPDTLSELLTVALDDLLKIEKRKHYKVRMDRWHDYRRAKDVCEICLAGSWLANATDIPRVWDRTPSMFADTRLSNRMWALEYVRVGNVTAAMEKLGIFPQRLHSCFDRKIPHYHTDRKGFFRELRKLARDLREEGL